MSKAQQQLDLFPPREQRRQKEASSRALSAPFTVALSNGETFRTNLASLRTVRRLATTERESFARTSPASSPSAPGAAS